MPTMVGKYFDVVAIALSLFANIRSRVMLIVKKNRLSESGSSDSLHSTRITL